jgi:hypothetical protein
MTLSAILDSIEGISPDIAQLYTKNAIGKYELTGISGIKTQADIDRLTGSLQNERIAHQNTKVSLETYKKLGDDPSKVQLQLDRIGELEAASGDKIDEEKLNEMVETRLQTKIAPLKRELDEANKKLTESSSTIQQFETKDIKRQIASSVASAAKQSNLISTAIDDATMMAENIFQIDESGKVVTKDNVGVTPGIDATVWLTDMREKRPHWWANSQGGGAGGNNGGSFGSSNPWAKDSFNMTEQSKMIKTNPVLAEQMKSAAGNK